jgi:hypothetical protein
MEIDFQEKMAGKTNEELVDYTQKVSMYVPEAINAAIAELKSRGHHFSKAELEQIQVALTKKEIQKAVEEGIRYNSSIDGDLVDWDTPRYYSKDAIFVVSALLSPLWGSILMAVNLHKKNKTGAALCLIFGVLSIFLISLARYSVSDYKWSLGFVLNALGGLFITTVIWNKYIGKDTNFIKRPAWIVLAIIIAIVLFLWLVMILGLDIRLTI